MKIAVLIPSRNRPRMLSAVITALHELKSGENEIIYRVGCDEDDAETKQLLLDYTQVFDYPIGFLCDQEQGTIGAIWNKLAQTVEADIYSCMIDDAFPISPHWDREMVNLAKKYQAFTWFEVSAPHNAGYPTCTKEWLNKVGYIVPEHFPFWFMDTWFVEMVQFVTNEGVPASQRMALYSKQEETQNLRDLQFWWDFFRATRPMRLRAAHKLLEPMVYEDFLASRQQFITAGNNRDREFSGEKIFNLEKERGSKTEPSQKYLLAKAKAERYIIDNGLTL